MKKAVEFGLMCFASSVFAQSSVTLYGIVDAEVTYESNIKGGRVIALTSGNEGSARWGLQGSEDLGSGAESDLYA